MEVRNKVGEGWRVRAGVTNERGKDVVCIGVEDKWELVYRKGDSEGCAGGIVSVRDARGVNLDEDVYNKVITASFPDSVFFVENCILYLTSRHH